MPKQISTGLLTAMLFFVHVHWASAQMGSVFYGERNLEMDQTALFLDKEGWWYPAVRIEDDSLRKAGSLKNWYANHPVDFENIAKQYACSFSGWTDENAMILNDSICLERIRFWNRTKARQLTLLVHGFRKTFHPLPYERDSPNDYQILRRALLASGAETGNVIEVYWDGMYGCCFSASPARNRPLFMLFETASEQAKSAGLALGKFLSGLKAPKIGLVSHSLGAKVALIAMTGPLSEPGGTGKDLRLCLVGPAIGPDLVLETLGQRQQNHDNSHLRIDLVYNEQDFVLRKKDPKLHFFGPGPRKFGDTRLGCNAGNAVLKLEKALQIGFPSITFTSHNLSVVGGCHHIWCYTREGLLSQVFLQWTK